MRNLNRVTLTSDNYKFNISISIQDYKLCLFYNMFTFRYGICKLNNSMKFQKCFYGNSLVVLKETNGVSVDDMINYILSHIESELDIYDDFKINILTDVEVL